MPDNLGTAEIVEPEEISVSSGAKLAEELLKAPVEPEADYAAERVTKEEFKAQAEDIFSSIRARQAQGVPRSKAFSAAYEAYVLQADNPRLRFQAEIILGGSQINNLSHEKNALANKVDERTASVEDKDRMRRIVEAIATYDHALRRFIMDNQPELSRLDVKSWLTKSSNGDEVWARRLVNGVTAEIAMLELFASESIVTMQETSVVQDVRDKTDMVAVHRDGRRRPLDIKHGPGRSDYQPSRESDAIQFEVIPEELDADGFVFKPFFAEENRRRILKLF